MGLNSHAHLLLETRELNKLKEEAKKRGISVNSLIRSKLSNPPTPNEILLLRQLKAILKMVK